jgi:epoxyqueuosine reductase
MPRELRPLVGAHVFGCDVCQEVCPHNASPKRSAGLVDFQPRFSALDLIGLLELTSSGYRKLVRGTALRRASRHQLQRNAAVALGNVGDQSAVPHLCRILADHPNAVVREHAAWALSRLGGPPARAALARATQADTDPDVRRYCEEYNNDLE